MSKQKHEAVDQARSTGEIHAHRTHKDCAVIGSMSCQRVASSSMFKGLGACASVHRIAIPRAHTERRSRDNICASGFMVQIVGFVYNVEHTVCDRERRTGRTR